MVRSDFKSFTIMYGDHVKSPWPLLGCKLGTPFHPHWFIINSPIFWWRWPFGVCALLTDPTMLLCWLVILFRSHAPILTSQTRLLAFSEPFAFNFDPASTSFPKEPRLKWVPAWSRCLLLPDWKRNLWWATPRSCELRCWSVDVHRSLALLVNSRGFASRDIIWRHSLNTHVWGSVWGD